jgi:EAL domain-containing protein (putative c-di-GMP-specific phosphodiesterase class I)/DNA-binding response OmpR family regulator
VTADRGSATNGEPLDPILVVDDEPAVRALFVRVLREAGYETLEAADGREALGIIQKHRPALLLVDSAMPRLDGAGLIRILRDREATRTLPIILITARSSLVDRVSGLQLGADDYLAKPVEIDELVARVRSQLRSHDAWVEAVQRGLIARRALTAALRRVRLDPSPELTARSIVEELSAGRDGLSVALLGYTPRGPAIPLASGGRLAESYRPGVPLPALEARKLLDRAIEGPWIQRVRTSEALPTTTESGAALDVAYIPLEAGNGPIGLLIMGIDAGPSTAGPTQALADQLPLLTELADLVTTLLRPSLEAGAVFSEARAALELIIGSCAFVPHFQPIVRLVDGSVLGYEGLTRFTDGCPPDVRFAEADWLELGPALESATLDSTVMAALTLPHGAALSLNVSPTLLLGDPTLDALLSNTDREVVLELTEHAPVADYDALRSRIERLGQSVRIAVDDAGAGYASLRHILALRAAFVKLDISLVRGIDVDSARQALIAGFVHFARETGCELIGEGIETEPERQALLRLGVQQGQGYLFGRPVPAPG